MTWRPVALSFFAVLMLAFVVAVAVLRWGGDDEPREAQAPPDSPLTDIDLRPGHTLGMRCSYASQFLRERHDLPRGKGCVVTRVGSPGAAERAGLRLGDKIVEMDGVPITSGRQFTRRFEELPGSGHLRFVVQRGDEELTLEVDLADGSGLPDDDPYFYYLRAIGDTGGTNVSQIIADYTRAIELEPAFELPYLYRGITNIGRDDAAARADLLRALELDPELTEAHRALARIRFRQGDFSGAFERIGRSIELNGCGVYVEPWDLDCGEDLMVRAGLYYNRLERGDDLLVERDVDMVADVVFLEPTVAATRFELAYMRGDDAAARELAQELLVTPLYSFNDQAVLRHGVRYMLEADTFVLDYQVGDWFYYTALITNIWAPDAPMQEAGVSGTTLYFRFLVPGLTGGETISWEVRRGPYRLGGSEDTNTTGDRFVIHVGGSRQLPAGHYELDVYVEGEPALTIPLDVP